MAYTTDGQVPIFGLCIDWETSGSDFDGWSHKTYQGISFGAVVFKFEDFSIVDSLYQEIKFDPTKWKWSADAEKIHGLSREYLEKNGVTSEEAATALASMIIKYFDPQRKIMFLGHNIAFDIGFTEQLMEPFGIMPKVHHVHLDTSGTGMIAFNRFRSNQLFKIIGLPPRQEHNALEDAIYTVELARSIRLLIRAALEG